MVGCYIKPWLAVSGDALVFISPEEHSAFVINCRTPWHYYMPNRLLRGNRYYWQPHGNSAKGMCSIGGIRLLAAASALIARTISFGCLMPRWNILHSQAIKAC